ncbi:alpha/beta hydrolase [Aspergillus stella-maris]|uniref:alpha/beta hydrolase n=1 Tax=Aspergillus stella-maris TaxID=1810926 RepID=UPI003CCD0D28
MATTGNPIFVFIPGAWHTADTFDELRSLMAEQGLDSEAIATPSVGASPPVKGLHADIEYTKPILQGVVENGRQVVVVTHSYGGIVGASAVEGLGYTQRTKAGLSGGVVMVVWMSSFVAKKGQSVLDLLGGNWLPWMLSKNNDGYRYSSEQETVFYNDLEPEEQQKRIALLKPQPTLSFTEPALYESWHDIPSMYLYCDKDLGLPLDFQKSFAATLGNPVSFHADASHSAFLSQPEQVIQGLRVALEKGRKQSGIV